MNLTVDALKLLLSVVLLIFSLPCALTSSTGYRGRVTRHGLNYASQVSVDLLMKYLPVAEIPDLCDKLGGMSLVLSNVTLTDFRRPTLKIDLIQDTATSSGGLRMVFSQLDPSIDCHMKMTYKWGFFSTSRDLFVTIATSNLTMKLEALIGTDEEGNGVLEGFTCEMDGSLQLASRAGETGAFSGLFDFMASTLNEKIKELMFTQACSNITMLLNTTVQTQMSAANMSRIVLDDEFILDLKFTSSPKVTENYIESSHLAGVFLRKDSGIERLLRSPIFPVYRRYSSRMLYAFVVDRVATSAWDAALRSNRLHFNVTSDTPGLNEAVPRFLSTSCAKKSLCLGKIYPELEKLYPQRVMELELVATPSDKKTFKFRGQRVEFRTPFTGDFFVRTMDSREPVLSVSAEISGRLIVYVNENRVFYNLTNLSISPNSTSNILERLSTEDSKLKTLLKLVNRHLIAPYLRELGNRGYPLDVPELPWLKFVNPTIIASRKQGIIVIGTDIMVDVDQIPGL